MIIHGLTRRKAATNVPYMTAYPLRRLCNWPRPFSIKTFAFPDSIRFSRSCRSGFPKCGPKNGRVSA